MSAAAAQSIVTDRVIARPLRGGDWEALQAIYGDEDLMTYWSHAPILDASGVRDKVASILDSPDWRAWAITVVGDDLAIGTLVAHDQRPGVTEIGYSLARTHWGRGYAREIVAALIDRLFAEGTRRVFADTDPENDASNRLLEALGFTLEGRLRGEWKTHLGVRDSFIWGRLATDPAPAIASQPAPPRARSARRSGHR